MPKYAFGERSKGRLATCHNLLITLMERVIARPDLPFDVTVLCGHRGKEEQNAAVAGGFSSTLWPNSKHNRAISEAVDVAPYPIDWNNTTRFVNLGCIVEAEWGAMVREKLVPEGVTMSWGGRWKKRRDCPHFELRGLTSCP
jgi:hypothetical protein